MKKGKDMENQGETDGQHFLADYASERNRHIVRMQEIWHFMIEIMMVGKTAQIITLSFRFTSRLLAIAIVRTLMVYQHLGQV